MNFGFTQEQELLREQVRRFVADRCPTSEVRRLAADPQSARSDLWPSLAALGCFGTLVPEQQGGLGLKWIDLVVVLEELGRGLCPLPALAQLLSVSALAVHGTSVLKAQWLGPLIDGTRIMVPAWMDTSHRSNSGVHFRAVVRDSGYELTGTKPFVLHADLADAFLVAFACEEHPDKVCLAVLETGPLLKVRTQPSIDDTKRAADLVLTEVLVPRESTLVLTPAEFTLLLDYGALATSAEAVGSVEASLAMTTQFARQREQFGSPIGRFQGVKHPIANMYVDAESMKSLTYFAAWAADADFGNFAKAVSLAKGFVAGAFNKMAIECVNLHGAMGFTEQYDIQLFLKRAKWVRPAFGDGQFHFVRAATL